MSVEEMIASLESQKLACLQQYEEAIGSLRRLHDSDSLEPSLPNRARFRPVPSAGKPASDLIQEDRGSY